MNTRSTEELAAFVKAAKNIPANSFFADAIVDWIQCSSSGEFIGTILKVLKKKNQLLYNLVEQELSIQINMKLSEKSF